jgi:cytochrome c oxidase subunit 2
MNEPKTFFLPQGASTFASDVDSLYYFIYWTSLVFFVLIVGAMLVFVVRYRRRSETETTPKLDHNNTLEIFWTVAPSALLLVMFLWGFRTFLHLRSAPPGAMEIQVTAQQWQWGFTYPDGTFTADLGVPVNEPIRLVMSSKDVIHSFWAPDFRQKEDVLPNRYTTTWFEATQTGVFPLFCSEYCGKGHSEMITKIKVMNREEYQNWLLTGGLGDISKMPLKDQGALFYKARGCIACHNVDTDAVKVGPSWKGIYGHTVEFRDGRSAVVDENYIRKSIMDPDADIVKGFNGGMPSFRGQLKDEQVNALIAYIKSLTPGAGGDETPPAAPEGAPAPPAAPAAPAQ